ncbi:hypothetical protein NDU88_007543 [Pleurodeles waltl]|uniref:Uncharacterized protein n=1 Tax=Pleurodeles waltl TaxID=8319 RepID=A0AAV7U1S4_PLEWA|nr:hypothetical protein NDU88_007543 [Pleurodeles waltl]
MDGVTSLEDKDNACRKELERLQQEILRLQDQQLDLKVHMEDLENRSRWNNIRIMGTPSDAEGTDLHEYVTALFQQVLGDPPETRIKLDRVHRVSPSRPAKAPPADILVCVRDFQQQGGSYATSAIQRSFSSALSGFDDHYPAEMAHIPSCDDPLVKIGGVLFLGPPLLSYFLT